MAGKVHRTASPLFPSYPPPPMSVPRRALVAAPLVDVGLALVPRE